ncbi:unnamed protein product [Acanthoscelides obtectus]|uniref:CCAAT/enhancer-binding protein zeta n=1 Tax=Acanthoscelides obtectus TaxID=200917 RepID=A0A9P0KPT0_ACAOB|nr:unnamed protein product [Acanthoscelides obtectus]CAK1621009.1 CCAAT/enhancer-binding protein zeta [Acanthoscelides obtectus]
MKAKGRKNHKDISPSEIEAEPESTKKWYEDAPKDPKNAGQHTEQILIELKEEARKCHTAEVNNYNSKKQNANTQWMKSMLSKGTISDKIAAHTLLIQENPMCNLETLRNLIGLVKVSKKKECIAAMGTLVELFLSDILIPTRKLKPFHQRPLSALKEMSSEVSGKRRKLLVYWYFEDQLKEIYTSFVIALNSVGHDTVESNKDKAVTSMYKLLTGNPEQEKNLLSHIVNKLGDPSQKIASKVIYCLQQLLYKHPNMQKVVLNEIEKFLFRANISKRAQYYSLCFLSQYHLSHETSEVAKKLIEVYFAFFKSCVKTGDIDSRMMSALLMGLNRAYPYAKVDISKISEHIETMYRLVHLAQFTTSLQALILLYQVCDFESCEVSRFYNALYKKLLDPSLLITTHKAMFLSLLYKALLKDNQVNRIKAFVKRLLQVSLYVQADFACGILYLVSQLVGKKPGLLTLTLEASSAFSLFDADEKYFAKEDTIEVKEEPDEIIEVCNFIKIYTEVSQFYFPRHTGEKVLQPKKFRK